jgi:hypothetical protein
MKLSEGRGIVIYGFSRKMCFPAVMFGEWKNS